MRRLTGRQREVLKLAADGLSYQQIGLKLGINYRTVKNHFHQIYNRLELKEHRRMVVAIIAAVRTGQITLG